MFLQTAPSAATSSRCALMGAASPPGIYDVGEADISVIAWSGMGEPTFPRFPVSQGLNGAAVSARSTVVVNDVANDPRYLMTFGSTRAEMIVPVFNPVDGTVVGTIDVESMKKNAFTDEDKNFMEECARVMARLWEAGNIILRGEERAV